jgi:hypothetical protein
MEGYWRMHELWDRTYDCADLVMMNRFLEERDKVLKHNANAST